MKQIAFNQFFSKWPLIHLSGFLMILMILGGYFYYKFEKEKIKEEKFSMLKAIAELKSSQILEFNKERYADLVQFTESPFVIENIEEWLKTNDEEIKSALLKRILLIKSYYEYENVIMVSATGKVLISLDPGFQLDSISYSNIIKAKQNLSAGFTDLYYSPAHQEVHFDFIGPVMNSENKVNAFVILRINASDYLFPLIQSWPTPSQSSEILLVRRENDNVLFLNELRFNKDAALKLSFPLSRSEIPAVQAALGHTGIFEGKDYRGVNVLSEIRPIESTPWFMISKIDTKEIYSEMQFKVRVIFIIIFLFLLLVGTGVAWYYNNRQKSIYKQLYLTQSELKESENRHQLLFEHTLDGMAYHRIIFENGKAVDYVYLQVNEAFARQTGLKDVIGKKASELVPGLHQTNPELLERYVKVTKTGIPIQYETYIEQRKTWFFTSLYALSEDIVVSVFKNITERKLAEQALLTSEAQLATIMDNLSEAVIASDTNGNVFLWNNPGLKMFGFSSMAEVQRSLHEFTSLFEVRTLDGILVPLEKWPLSRILNGEVIRNWDVRLRHLNTGIETIFSYSGSLVHNDLGQPLMALVTVNDITDRKRIEEELRKSEAEFRTLAESMPQIVWATRPDGWNIYFNQQWVDYTGMTLEESYGHGWNKPFHSDDQQGAWDAWQNAVNNNGTYSVEARLRRFDGEYRWWLVRGIPQLNEQGEILKWFGTCTDIEDIKNAEEEINRLNEALEKKVEDRTSELEIKIKELNRLNKLFIDRELRMIELKQKIKDLEKGKSG